MLNDNLENRRIYGYSKSKEKKRMDTILDSMPGKGIESADAFVPSEGLAEVGTTLDRVNSTVDVLGNKEQRSEFHRNIARESLVPTDTEQRRRHQFVLSDNVIDDAVDEYYQNRVLPEFTQQRQSAEDRASGIFRENAAVPGADPLATIGVARNAADPAKVIGNTMERLDNDELNRIPDAYARYGGLDTDAYRKHALEPNLQNRMYGDYVKRSTPTGSLEYIGTNEGYNNLCAVSDPKRTGGNVIVVAGGSIPSQILRCLQEGCGCSAIDRQARFGKSG
jgi:hypothetical protein